MSEYEYEYLNYSNNTEYKYEYTQIWIQKSLDSNKYQNLEWQKYHSGSSVPLNTTENLRFWRGAKFILFGFQTSTEYEYE